MSRTWMSASLGVTLVGCVMCVGIAQAQSSTSSASPPLTSSGVSVSTPARTSLQIGTAFVVADGYVLTALHVVEGKEMILLGPMDRTRWMRAELVKSDAKLDLALLKARLVLPALSFVRWSEVPVGLEVSVIGFPQPRVQGLSKKITQGIINGNRSDRNESIDTGYFQLSAEVAMGNSGGPVLAPDGSVVGMVQKKVNVQGVAERTNDVLVNVSFALKSAQLLEFLKDTPAQPVVRPLAIETVLRPYQLFAQTEPSVLAVVARQPSSRSSSESPP